MSLKISENSPSLPPDPSHQEDNNPVMEKKEALIQRTAIESFQRLSDERSAEKKEITITTSSTSSSISVNRSIPTVIKAFKLDKNGKKTGGEIELKVSKGEREDNGHKGYIYRVMAPDGQTVLGSIEFYEGGNPQQRPNLAAMLKKYALHTKLIFIKDLGGGTDKGWHGIGFALIQIAQAHASMITDCPGIYTQASYNSPGFYRKCGFTTKHFSTIDSKTDAKLDNILAEADKQGTIPDTSMYGGYMYLFLAGKPPEPPS